MKIDIEKHTPLDGDYWLVMVDGRLFAKTYLLNNAEKIKEALEHKCP